jgi:HD-GYP domain-containing protein (c-di-GMP phosphodiesterase class II)
MAVGDIFTALTEDRPYRAGMEPKQALDILEAMVGDGALDGELVALVRKFFPDVDEIRRNAQQEALGEFAEFTTYLAAMAETSAAAGDAGLEARIQ